MFWNKKYERIEPQLDDFVVMAPAAAAVPIPPPIAKTLRFLVTGDPKNTKVVFERDGQAHHYVGPCTNLSSAGMIIMEGIRKLAESDPGVQVYVVDHADGRYRQWVTEDRGGAKRDLTKLPKHTITWPA